MIILSVVKCVDDGGRGIWGGGGPTPEMFGIFCLNGV